MNPEIPLKRPASALFAVLMLTALLAGGGYM